MFTIWIRAITRPVLATYEAILEEEPNPTLGKAVMWVTIAGAIAGVAAELLSIMWQILILGFPEGAYLATALFVPGFIIVIVRIALAALVLVISSALQLAVARALGGRGTLGSQSYALAAAWAPMAVVVGALAGIPVFGMPRVVLAILAPGVYVEWLSLLALRAAHSYGWGRALVTRVTPLILAGLVAGISLLLLLAPAVLQIARESLLRQLGY